MLVSWDHHASRTKRAEFAGPQFWGSYLYFMPTPFKAVRQNSATQMGRCVLGVTVNHTVAFAQMRRAVCQRQLSFLFSISYAATNHPLSLKFGVQMRSLIVELFMIPAVGKLTHAAHI